MRNLLVGERWIIGALLPSFKKFISKFIWSIANEWLEWQQKLELTAFVNALTKCKFFCWYYCLVFHTVLASFYNPKLQGQKVNIIPAYEEIENLTEDLEFICKAIVV